VCGVLCVGEMVLVDVSCWLTIMNMNKVPTSIHTTILLT
jgi:hypothetical protein